MQDLSVNDLYSILKLRQDIFVVEQNCVFPDIDDKDSKAIHVFYKEDKTVVAYARVFAPTDYHQEYSSIGRIVVHSDFRRKDLGKLLVNACIDYCRQNFAKTSIKISAQSYLNKFYTNLGFVDTGNHYLEDGIPHQEMILSF